MKNDKIEYITGSWFPSGFHGHFRSKSRTEYTIPFRQHAKPPPPEKFLNRSKVRSNHHLFSKHDNRNSHSEGMSDLEIHFNMGLGKRKSVDTQHSKSTSSLLYWNGIDKQQKIVESNYTETYGRSYLSSSSETYQQQQQQQPQQNILSKRLHKSNNTIPIQHYNRLRNPTIQHVIANSTTFPSQRYFNKPPLLAWADSNNDSNSIYKPCVGNTTNRIIPRVISN